MLLTNETARSTGGEKRVRLSDALVFALAAATLLLWLIYLLLQTGHIWDESEHAHVAWLMSQGQRPLDDFFQHHQPLLWDLLSVYYRAGFNGAGVLLWGRVLVAVCGLACIWALSKLGRSKMQSHAWPAALGGAVMLVALTVYLPELFVSRPETVSLASMLVALVIWNRGGAGVAVLVGGALAGAACYASPRFALFGGFFLLLGNQTPRRWLLLTGGGVLFVLLYTLLSGFSFEKIIFNLTFSSYLQSVGDAPVGRSAEYWRLFAAVVVASMLPLLVPLPRVERLRGVLLVAYLFAIFAACHHLAGMFRYVQAYAPFVGAAPTVAASLLARSTSDSRSVAVSMAASVLVLVAGFNLSGAMIDVPRFRLAQIVHDKNALAAMIPSGSAVLFYADRHPITVGDASYYASPLFDAQDRLCRAVRNYQGSMILPPCDYLQEIQDAAPYILDSRIARAVRTTEVEKLDHRLESDYTDKSVPGAYLLDNPRVAP